MHENPERETLSLKRQFHGFELVFGFLGGLQVFLGGCERLVAEPLLHRSDVYSRPEPAGSGGVSETVEMPFGWVELRALGDLFASVVEKAVVEVALRRWEHQRAIRYFRMLAQDLRHFSRKRHRA